MEEAWGFEFLSRAADGCVWFVSEFAEEWLASDMRAALFKALLGWLLLSLAAIHLAWRVYGNTVNDMYYRQGAGQNGGAPDAAAPLRGWERGDPLKTHQD